ncbi:MAG: GntR family transcriptional regulator [Spirochaetia bacterium]|nr:GntR family transcriptional regulator [Spirochaetia bacterium]
MNLKNERIISTIKDQVYEVLKANIVNGSLTPGQRIQELQIAKELNVSRSPVRNAINQLIGEGLLESVPNKSVFVRKISEHDIIEAYEFRLIIELYAVRKVAENRSEQIAQRLREFRTLFTTHAHIEDLAEYLKIDSDFHQYLVESAGNTIISEALTKVSMLITPFRIYALSSPKRFYESVDEHIRVIEALLDHDGEQAVTCCANHLAWAKEEILNYLNSRNTEE